MRSRIFTLHKEVPFIRKKRRATPLPFLVLTPLLDRTFAIGHCGLTCAVCCCFLVRAIRPNARVPPPNTFRFAEAGYPVRLPVPEIARNIKRNNICIAWIYTNP